MEIAAKPSKQPDFLDLKHLVASEITGLQIERSPEIGIFFPFLYSDALTIESSLL